MEIISLLCGSLIHNTMHQIFSEVAQSAIMENHYSRIAVILLLIGIAIKVKTAYKSNCNRVFTGAMSRYHLFIWNGKAMVKRFVVAGPVLFAYYLMNK